ncbi:MAG TPA: DUF4279 domain-containing protein [Alphaproteobacteria bacterium]|nr:DUF4279 domain-containing protein [Alphaproteobacteria bacterium]
MQKYSYYLDLRIWHPSISPDEITRELGIQPKYAWQAGQRRKTPKGTLLDGVYRESYWSTDPFGDGEISSSAYEAEDRATELLDILEPRRDVLLRLKSEGARIFLQISPYSNRMYGFEFSPDFLARCAGLGITLAFEIHSTP